MNATAYDVIVVGARCAGSPTAMLLARQGLRVLLVDRATFPSDTVSTHLLHPPGVAALARWGLLDRVVATGCPPIHTYHFDLGDLSLTGAPGTDESPVAYAPRRSALDLILLEAAAAAGAEVREGFSVSELLVEDDRVVGIRGRSHGREHLERAKVVVGADGLHSTIAARVGPERYDEKPRLLSGCYSYWSGLPMDGRFETYLGDHRAFAAWPTSDELTVVIAGWPFADRAGDRSAVEARYLALFDFAPGFVDRMSPATRQGGIVGAAVPAYFRRPFGPGWALVGDAGYHKDFITAQGMQDAFRDAELCARAILDALARRRTFVAAMTEYQATRDAAVAEMYELTADLASLEPPPPELQSVLQALSISQAGMDLFARVNAGVTPPHELFATVP